VRARHAVALCAFSTLANLRSRPGLLGPAAFLVVTALGHALAWTAGDRAPEDDRLFGYGFLVGAVLLLRSGLAEQRRTGLAEFLRQNFLTPGEQMAGHAGALLLQLTAFCILAFVGGATLSGGDLRYAAWYTALMGLATALVLPLILGVEMVSDFRLPLVVVVLGVVVAGAGAGAVLGTERFLGALGLRVVRYEPGSLLPLVRRVSVALPLGFAVLGLIHTARHPRPDLTMKEPGIMSGG
jgi:hypothetical protein